jgi:predicted transcriptional regulator
MRQLVNLLTLFFIFFFIFSISTIPIAYTSGASTTATTNWVVSDGLNDDGTSYLYPQTLYNQVSVSFYNLPIWIQILSIVAFLMALVAVAPFIIGRLKNVLDNEKRQAILTYIMENPGCTIADISDTQKINRGTVKYHIFQLELSGKVFTKHEDKFARLFHKTSEFKDMERVITPYLRNDTSKAILLVIMDSPGITNQDLSSKFNLDKSTVHWYLQKFNHDGIINFVKDGKFRKCFMKTEAKMVLLRFMPA